MLKIMISFFLSFIMAFAAYGAEKIKVGILHSLSGTMAISERTVVDSTLLAIQELNSAGGLLGKQIQPLVKDGASDWPTFAREAEELIVREKVDVVFGCWTSASRKTVKPVFEKHNHLLFYPVQYEGLEESPNIIYTGAAPNQQLIPAAAWAIQNLGKRFFLVGSDYVFPRAANKILRYKIEEMKGKVVGEQYLLLGDHYVTPVIEKIKETKPDVILNTLNGDSNISFFNQLNEAGFNAKNLPVISFSIAEAELAMMGADRMVGHYAAWNYFQSIKRPENTAFIKKFQKTYGRFSVLTDPMEAAYFGVHLWAKAVRAAGTSDVNAVRKNLVNQQYNAPEGSVRIAKNHHTWKGVRVGQIQSTGQFKIVWSWTKPLKPIPYPKYLSKAQWNSFLQQLYEDWGGSWANPGE